MRRLMVTAIVLVLLLAACGSGSADNVGDLTVENITANLTLPTETGAVYMQITNGGDTDDALIDATIPGCGTVELHEVVMVNDVMTMQQIEGNRIPIPAGESVMLKRGGLHVMCIDKTGDFAIGDSVPVTLVFENAGTIEVAAEVIDPGEMPANTEGGSMGSDNDN